MSSDGIRYADLPLISVLDEKQMKRAKDALEELDSLQQLIGEYKERQEELKLELESLQKAAGKEGLRLGELCFVARTMPGRETLDKVKLMEQGVTAEQLTAAMKRGKPYDQRTFKNLSRKSDDES